MKNTTSFDCFKGAVDESDLTNIQLAILTIFNFVVMIGNIFINPIVMYILIKTKQLKNIACMVIFILTITDTLIPIFSQNLFFFQTLL